MILMAKGKLGKERLWEYFQSTKPHPQLWPVMSGIAKGRLSTTSQAIVSAFFVSIVSSVLSTSVLNGGVKMEATQGRGSAGLRPIFMTKGGEQRWQTVATSKQALAKVAPLQSFNVNSKQYVLFFTSQTRGEQS